VVQVSKTRDDGWAFGSKLLHANEELSRQLVLVATDGASDDADNANIVTDTGWFELDATQDSTADDLALLTNAMAGDSGALTAPSNWEPVKDPTVVQQHDIQPGSEEFQSVSQAFMSTLPSRCKVESITRIQNLAMWQSYVVKRQTICYRETLSKGDAAAEDQLRALDRFERSWLWHGTNIEVMDKILQQGFNRSFCGKNATA